MTKTHQINGGPNHYLVPAALELLLYYHYRVEPHPNRQAPVVHEWTLTFIKAGLIEGHNFGHGETFHTTEKGRFYIEHLMSIPFPVETTVFAIPGTPPAPPVPSDDRF